MNVDFSKTNNDAQSVPVTPAPEQSQVPAIINREWQPSISEIIVPRINLVQNSGNLKESFSPGAIVYDKRTLLYTPPKINALTQTQERAGTAPLIVTALNFRETRFVEKTDGNSRGQIVTTEAAVRAAGGTLDYNEFKLKEKDGMKRFEYMADGLFAVERPDIVADDDSVFVYPVDGKKYTLAVWSLKGSIYNHACKGTLFRDKNMGCLRPGWATFSYAVTTRIQLKPQPYFIPVFVPNKANTPEFLTWTQDVLKAPQRDSDAAE